MHGPSLTYHRKVHVEAWIIGRILVAVVGYGLQSSNLGLSSIHGLGGSLLDGQRTGTGKWGVQTFYLIDLIKCAGLFPVMISFSPPPHHALCLVNLRT